MSHLVRRLLHLFRRSRHDAELLEEMETHRSLRQEALERDGLAHEEAADASRRALGNVRLAVDDARDVWLLRTVDSLWLDLRSAVRSLAASKVFTAVSILTLALGIGANAAIFAILNGAILRPLGYPQPDRLMFVSTRSPALGLDSFWVSPVEYFEFRELNQSFSSLGAFHVGEVNLFDGDQPHRVRSAAVDEHLLATLGVPAAHGRLFGSGETNSPNPPTAMGQPPPGTAPAVIVSHELWQRVFGGRPLVGEHVDIEGIAREVIGILPPGIDLMDHHPDVWLPVGLNPADRRNRAGHFLSVIGRLKDAVSVESARAELNTLIDTWGDRVGVSGEGVAGHTFAPPNRTMYRGKKVPNPGHVLQIAPLKDVVIGSAARSIWMLQASVGLVLLIACANLASLFMARADSRRRELAVRTALGATPRRLLQQFIAEGMLLVVAGGVLGVEVARAAVTTLARVYPDSLPRMGDLTMDGSVVLFAVTVSIVSALLFAAAPLVHTRITALATAVREGTDRQIGGSTSWARTCLVIAEVALAVMLVAGASLLSRSVLNLTHVDAGFNRSRLITFSTTLPQVRYPQPESRARAYQSMLARLRTLPGVASASAMSGLPPERLVATQATDFDGYVQGPNDPPEFADYTQYVLGSYFQTMGIPIVQGRAFEASDETAPEAVAVVNRTLADTFWKGVDPIGQRLRPCCSDKTPWFTVIGVAADVKQGGIDKKVGSEIYFSIEQTARQTVGIGTMHVVLRTTAPFDEIAPFIRSVVRETDPTVPIVRLREMDDVFQDAIRRPRLVSSAVNVFAAFALLIAMIGIYGLLSYTVVRRRREIGVRMALGASRVGILSEILRWGVALILLGTGAGLAAALALSRLITSLLFEIAATDVTTLAAVAVGVIAVGGAACAIPAWRASRLDPLLLIREN